MADIELKYGPGSSLTILKSGLSALRLKANLQVEVEEVESGMGDALVLHLAMVLARKARSASGGCFRCASATWPSVT